MESAKQAFGQRVRAARLSKGWTQEELSARSGLAVVQISRIERGVREVRLTTILRLVDALAMRPDEMLGDLHAD
jgi:transcriptional regulator with XRE-family HTH domain